MIDLKYHVYTLAAVFFALAVGIVIGTSFAKLTPTSPKERRAIRAYTSAMRSLKTQIEQVSQEANHGKHVLRDLDDFAGQVSGSLVRGRLAFRNVSIIRTGDYDSAVNCVRRSAEAAGARVTNVTNLNRKFDFSDETAAASALDFAGVRLLQGGETARAKLISIIANASCVGRPTAILAALEAAGVAKFRGDYTQQNRIVVIVGGSADNAGNTASSVDARIISALRRPDVTVVGCESSDATVSYIPVWNSAGAATVDCVDWQVGQVALVYALTGENGRFGIKDTADQVLPYTIKVQP